MTPNVKVSKCFPNISGVLYLTKNPKILQRGQMDETYLEKYALRKAGNC